MTNEFWERANENLQAAKMLFTASLFNAAANRAYYAAFHAAATIIEVKGLQFISDHKKVQSTFSNEVLRRSKHLSSELKQYLPTMHNCRAIADYEKPGVSKQKAKEQIHKAKYFLSCIEKEL